MTDQDPTRIVEGLEALLEWIAQNPGIRERDIGKQMTFREFNAQVEAKAKELGVEPETVRPFARHPDVRHAEVELSMFLDEHELFAPEYFWDLPLGYRFAPEYQPLLQAEQAWIEQNGDTLEEADFTRLYDAIKHLIPERPER